VSMYVYAYLNGSVLDGARGEHTIYIYIYIYVCIYVSEWREVSTVYIYVYVCICIPECQRAGWGTR